MLGMDSMAAPLIWSEAKMKTQAINLGQGNHPLGISRYGM
nr:unknown [Medicago truncatula]